MELPFKPCKKVGCTNLTRGTYCEAHIPPQAPRRESGAWHFLYGTKRWKELRIQQLISEPWCRECAAKAVTTPAGEVDHIKPHRGSKKLFYDAGNLQSLCASCHSRKTQAEVRARQALPPP